MNELKATDLSAWSDAMRGARARELIVLRQTGAALKAVKRCGKVLENYYKAPAPAPLVEVKPADIIQLCANLNCLKPLHRIQIKRKKKCCSQRCDWVVENLPFQIDKTCAWPSCGKKVSAVRMKRGHDTCGFNCERAVKRKKGIAPPRHRLNGHAAALAVCLMLALLTGCVSTQIATPPPSPTKGKTAPLPTPRALTAFIESQSKVMAQPIIQPIWTNSLNFIYTASTTPWVTGYAFSIGPADGIWTNMIDEGMATNISMNLLCGIYENPLWFFAVRAYAPSGFGTNLYSDYSNTAHWPPYARIFMGQHLSWPASFPVTVETCLNFQWTNFASNVVGSCDIPADAGLGFHGFRLRQPDGTPSQSITVSNYYFQPL